MKRNNAAKLSETLKWDIAADNKNLELNEMKHCS